MGLQVSSPKGFEEKSREELGMKKKGLFLVFKRGNRNAFTHRTKNSGGLKSRKKRETEPSQEDGKKKKSRVRHVSDGSSGKRGQMDDVMGGLRIPVRGTQRGLREIGGIVLLSSILKRAPFSLKMKRKKGKN